LFATTLRNFFATDFPIANSSKFPVHGMKFFRKKILSKSNFGIFSNIFLIRILNSKNDEKT
jgi:hypothetical protein